MIVDSTRYIRRGENIPLMDESRQKTRELGWLRYGPKHIYWLGPICINGQLEKSCLGEDFSQTPVANFARATLAFDPFDPFESCS